MRFQLRFSHRPNPGLTKMLAPMTNTFLIPRISPVVILVSSMGERVCLQSARVERPLSYRGGSASKGDNPFTTLPYSQVRGD